MKTKIIGLAAIMLALVMATGIASATEICPFLMKSKIGVGGEAGWADHSLLIDNSYFNKTNYAKIGNFNLTCESPDYPVNKTDAISKITDNITGNFGTGTIQTAYALLNDRRTFQIEQQIDADKVYLIEQEYINRIECDPDHHLVLATEGTMDWDEIKAIKTTGTTITGLLIDQKATMNATSVGGTSLVYSEFNADQLGFSLLDRACGAEAEHLFLIEMPPNSLLGPP